METDKKDKIWETIKKIIDEFLIPHFHPKECMYTRFPETIHLSCCILHQISENHQCSICDCLDIFYSKLTEQTTNAWYRIVFSAMMMAHVNTLLHTPKSEPDKIIEPPVPVVEKIQRNQPPPYTSTFDMETLMKAISNLKDRIDIIETKIQNPGN